MINTWLISLFPLSFSFLINQEDPEASVDDFWVFGLYFLYYYYFIHFIVFTHFLLNLFLKHFGVIATFFMYKCAIVYPFILQILQ